MHGASPLFLFFCIFSVSYINLYIVHKISGSISRNVVLCGENSEKVFIFARECVIMNKAELFLLFFITAIDLPIVVVKIFKKGDFLC